MIFSQSRISLFSDSSREWVWRLNDQEFDIKGLQPTVKHFVIQLWHLGAIWSNCRSEQVEYHENITSVKYVSILQEGLPPIFSSGRMMKNESLFMEHWVPCHTPKNTQNSLLQNGTKKLSLPSQSSDINPIEHLWASLERKIRKKVSLTIFKGRSFKITA